MCRSREDGLIPEEPVPAPPPLRDITTASESGESQYDELDDVTADVYDVINENDIQEGSGVYVTQRPSDQVHNTDECGVYLTQNPPDEPPRIRDGSYLELVGSTVGNSGESANDEDNNSYLQPLDLSTNDDHHQRKKDSYLELMPTTYVTEGVSGKHNGRNDENDPNTEPVNNALGDEGDANPYLQPVNGGNTANVHVEDNPYLKPINGESVSEQ